MDDKFYFLIEYFSGNSMYVETSISDKEKLKEQLMEQGRRVKKIEQLERALSPEEVGKLLGLNLHTEDF